MSLLPKSINRCRRYPTKFNSGRDIPPALKTSYMKTTKAFRLQEVRQSHTARVYGRDRAPLVT